MNDDDTNRGGWMGSDLRKKLNSEILDRFPADLRVKMLPTETGDLLRLATETEIFGFNEYGRPEEFEESLTQWPRMAIRRNRIGFQGYDSDAWGWTWLMNSVGKVFFADVRSRGLSYYDSASDVHGVRPLFLIDLS